MWEFLGGSLSLRIAVTLSLVLTVILLVFIFVATNVLRSDLFSTRRDMILADAAVRFSQVQNTLDQSTAVTTDQVQDAVTQTLTAIRESAAGAGAVEVLLLRSPDSSEAFRINEYVNPEFISVIGGGIRDELAHDVGLWQSVALSNGTDMTPGIVVGAL